MEVWRDNAVRYRVQWNEPTERERRAYCNTDDATRDGAYAMALAAAKSQLGLQAHSRSDRKTGCDWYLEPATESGDELNYDTPSLTRLEVSGIANDDRGALLRRVSRKLKQLRKASDSRDSLAAVIGFRSRTVLFRRCE